MDQFLRLHQELHARPLPEIQVGSTVFHLAYFRGDVSMETEKDHLDTLATNLAAELRTAGDSHFQLTIGGSSLRVEFHTEFTEYTFIKNTIGDFDGEPVLHTIPKDWLDHIPGKTVNRLQIHIEPAVEFNAPFDAARSFGRESVLGSNVSDEQMRVWTDFRVAAHGNMRILLECKTDDAARIGRAVQRMIDIENYRMLAFIGLQQAREISLPMTTVESKLESVMRSFQDIDTIQDERDTLGDLTNLSAEVELLKARSMNRFARRRPIPRSCLIGWENCGRPRLRAVCRSVDFCSVAAYPLFGRAKPPKKEFSICRYAFPGPPSCCEPVSTFSSRNKTSNCSSPSTNVHYCKTVFS